MFKKYKKIKKFKKYYLSHTRTIKILLVVMILASSLGMLLPFFMTKRLIGITDNIKEEVILYTIIIFVVILFHHIFWYLWEKIASILTNKVAASIREDIINKMYNTKYLKLKDNSSGYYLERINDDVLEVSSFLSNVLGLLVDLTTNFGFLILIFILNYECGIIFSIGIISLYFVDLIKIKKDLKYTEIIKELSEKMNTKINESYRGIKEIKGLGIINQIQKNTVCIISQISLQQISKDRSYALYSRIKTFFQYALESVLILYSITYLIPTNQISIVILLMILDYSGFMYELIGFFAKLKEYFEKGNYKASRILEIFNNKNQEKYGKSIINNIDSITIDKLSYSYGKKDKILDNISLKIFKNSISVFIGYSGSGKSTLFGLMSKLLEVDNNKIFFDDKDINEIEEASIRNLICMVNQEPFMINDTIYNNLKIVRPDATYEEIIQACKKSNIYDEIIKMKKQFDTIVLENGSNFSGGQKQRIEIARALIKDSKILFFDEPTSALDKKNQEIFFKTLKAIKSDRIILLIAHKITNYKEIDNIFELKNGNIIYRNK